ncbi:uncharacterized protein LOC120666251 [Panicum virgatum]|uniref:RRM domain-containing protein n=1 Tax=Panicum virgatum TaxID=38727 RepID=A0A8T0W4T7_PANVG|nr:uncharacterized protein LOC120666251 [Panicum virgatum]KAG2640936.1 hypothetical protein PVAP13_2KG130900 [Panicum virgatum]
MSRSRSDHFPSSSPTAAIPGRMLCAKEIATSKNLAAEASKDTSARKIAPPGNKIRIRLPPRKRLAEGVQTMSTVVPEDTKIHPAKKVSEHTDENTPSTTFVDNKVKAEEVCSKDIGEGQCQEANSNCLITTMSNSTLPEEPNLIVSSLNLTTATEVQVKEEFSYPERKELCEEGNKFIINKGLPLEDSSNMPRKESYIGAISNTPSKNKSIISKVEKNNCSCIIPSKRLLCETNSNSSSKGVTIEAKINNSRKNVTTSAVKGEEANGNTLGNNLFEEARKNTATAKLSTEAINCAPSRRPADPANDKKSSKKLRTSAVHATGTSHNPSRMKLSTSASPDVEQSTSAAFLEATKEYKEFEEKVKRTVYLDNLSLLATDAVIKMALNQFGNVKNVNFLTNYTVPFDIPQSALVEMETEKDAEYVVNMLDEFPFMMSGMPRPVRVKRATAVMFNDRPQKPGRKLEFCWVGPTDPDFHDVRRFKLMSKRHEVENLALIKNQLHEEALLAKHQQDNLNFHYRKLESIDGVIMTGWLNHLTRIYNLNFDEVY